MTDKIAEQQKIKLGEVSIDLNPDNMYFSESTLSEYYQREGGYYDFYSAQLAYADYLLSVRANDYENVYNLKFREYKDQGGSDKYAEARAKSDAEVIDAAEKLALAKYKRNLLQQHLRAWDRNHENALALGHMIRKEMDKLHFEVKSSPHHFPSHISEFAQELDLDELKKEEN